VNTDTVVCCGGIRGAETSLGKLDPHAMILTYQINAMGPLLVIKVPTANKKINFGMFYRF
jgi:hypothetical protein